MYVYRIVKSKYAAELSGEGARLFGGRWNDKGTPCLYASESRSLALLEYTVNVNVDDIPRALSLTTIEIPDHIHEVTISELPGNWRLAPAPADAAHFGTALLRSMIAPSIKIPSVVIPEEFNYLLNPLHPDKELFRIVEIKDFIYDLRIKTI